MVASPYDGDLSPPRIAPHGVTRRNLGAELNAEIEHQTARDSMVGDEKPLGSRGAVMADTVGKAVV